MNRLSKKICRLQQLGGGIGGFFYLLIAIGLIGDSQAAFVSYLTAYIFWFGLALGCLNVSLIHHLTAGAWGNLTRRFFEAGYMTLPVLAILFIPILFGLQELYPWANPAAVAADKVLRHKSAYENAPGFSLRALLFFAVWIQIAWWLRKWSLQQDAAVDAAPAMKAKTLSGPGIVLVSFTASFALVDWVMSIEAAWFSTVFALILLISGVLIAFAWGIILLAWLQAEIPFAGTVTPKPVLDLGNLLLAFVMFWTYVAFSQLLIIYSGNQPHEIGWYLPRVAGGWKWLLLFIALFHFFVPFLVLLSRSYKQNLRALATISAVIFLVNGVQNFWMIAPTFRRDGISIHWTDLAAWLGIGGLWVSVFARNLAQHPLLVGEAMGPESATEGVIREK